MQFFITFTRGKMFFGTLARIVPRLVDGGCEADAQICENYVKEDSGYRCQGDTWETVDNVVATIHRWRHLFGRGGPRDINDVEHLAVGLGRLPETFREVVAKKN